MWLKLKNGTYVNLTSAVRMSVAGTAEVGYSVRVRVLPNVPADVVQDGYSTEQEAQDALDEFILSQDFAMVQPPLVDEEVEELEVTE